MGYFHKIVLLFLPLLLSFLFTKKEQQLYSIHGYAQGTDYSIKYFADSALIAKEGVDSILMKIDSSMSLYKPYSLISKFNSSENGVSLDPHFLAVIRKSFEIFKDTQGKFDVTVAPLVQAWGFGPKPISVFPDSAEITELLKNVGMDYLELKGNKLLKSRPNVHLDLNGIAQGYSVDVVADYLEGKGIHCYMVEIGGEIRLKGRKPDGTAMKIGIEGPAPDGISEPQIRHVISFTEGAVTTSGNYRKFIKSGNKKISHLVNPKTGYPLNTELISVTIFAKDALTADGYDNAIMAMGLHEALTFIAARKNMEAYIIYQRKDGVTADTLTTGFKKLIIN
ncbi:FAD:protein FMN transferase [Pedobacter nutrimenti]|uniref:FAD:protein FMN transferase n=1 Tax=Pedobacter nutrimenti TaxID=1241337 RepID=UPI00292E3B9A|nr:FAD:protein FMN transferase [Pedobacter nutrimenti]